jgi:endogenous inhibitor of DNA gyrase (YacG/DUF329 family)
MKRAPTADTGQTGSTESCTELAMQRIVRCPACGGDSVYATSNPSRPFCSERCKGMDLGAWASESFRVAAAPSPDDPPWEPGDLH